MEEKNVIVEEIRTEANASTNANAEQLDAKAKKLAEKAKRAEEILLLLKEKNKKDLNELESLAQKAVEVYNELYQDGDYNEAHEIDVEIEECCNLYTAKVKEQAYTECLESAEPLRTAVTKLIYTSIMKSDKKVGEEKIPVRSINPSVKFIDLKQLNTRARNGVGKDKDWIWAAHKLNFLLTARTAMGLGIDPKVINDSYVMNDIASKIEMGKTPTSNTQLLVQLQMVLDMMFGKDELKAKSHDVNFLLGQYTSKGKTALATKCADTGRFIGIIAKVCNHLITGDPYTIESKELKTDKK